MLVVWKDILAYTTFQLLDGKMCNGDPYEKQQNNSLRAWNVFSGNRCKCSGACNTRRCQCKKKGIDCSSFCHSKRDCENKKYDH